MKPRWHILCGIIFGLIIFIVFPEINLLYLLLIFLSAVLIDFDHYMVFVLKTGRISLFNSFKWYEEQLKKEAEERRNNIKRKGHFHSLHTIEFHILVYLLGYLWVGFFYVFIGMVFHSICDFVWLIWKDRLYKREYFFMNWAGKNAKKNI
jgi:hypothetical protein